MTSMENIPTSAAPRTFGIFFFTLQTHASNCIKCKLHNVLEICTWTREGKDRKRWQLLEEGFIQTVDATAIGKVRWIHAVMHMITSTVFTNVEAFESLTNGTKLMCYISDLLFCHFVWYSSSSKSRLFGHILNI